MRYAIIAAVAIALTGCKFEVNIGNVPKNTKAEVYCFIGGMVIVHKDLKDFYIYNVGTVVKLNDGSEYRYSPAIPCWSEAKNVKDED